MQRSRTASIDKRKQCEDLFNELPIETKIRIHFNHSDHYLPQEVIIINKQKHSDYTFSFFAVSLDRKYGGYFWIKPDYLDDYFSRKVTSFEIIEQ